MEQLKLLEIPIAKKLNNHINADDGVNGSCYATSQLTVSVCINDKLIQNLVSVGRNLNRPKCPVLTIVLCFPWKTKAAYQLYTECAHARPTSGYSRSLIPIAQSPGSLYSPSNSQMPWHNITKKSVDLSIWFPIPLFHTNCISISRLKNFKEKHVLILFIQKTPLMSILRSNLHDLWSCVFILRCSHNLDSRPSRRWTPTAVHKWLCLLSCDQPSVSCPSVFVSIIKAQSSNLACRE